MLEELVKEKREQRDREETEKIFSAIHEQAYWNKKEEERKAIIQRMEKKPQKKSKAHQLFQQGLCFTLMLTSSFLTIMLLYVLCY